MADHVAVLRRMRDELAADRDGARLAASLDHAIAACEQHAALVARLGELVAEWRENESTCLLRAFTIRHECADDLARVVKPEGAGE